MIDGSFYARVASQAVTGLLLVGIGIGVALVGLVAGAVYLVRHIAIHWN